MPNLYLYQQKDSLNNQNADTAERKQIVKNEVQQNNIAQNSQDLIQIDSLDTVFGIEKSTSIPYRKVKIKPKDVHHEEVIIDQNLIPTYLRKNVETWQTILLLLSFFLLGFVRAFNNNRLSQSIKALFNISVAQEIIREEKVFFHRANLILTSLHFITFSLFVYNLSKFLNREEGIFFYFLIVVFIVATYLIKYIFSKIIFFVFSDHNVSSEYIFTITLYNNFLGIMLIPILCIDYFTDLTFVNILNYMALPTVLLIFILRLIRLTQMGKLYGVSYVYIFLYICTLEILPLVVLYKIFILK